MQKVGIIIQARMTSTRLPGKILMDVGGIPLLEFIIRRLETLTNNIDLIVATTTDSEDDKIVKLCESINIPYYRGARENVLNRYVECAKKYNIEVVIRVCSDCPFIDPSGINELIKIYHQNPTTDLVHNKHKSGYPLGTGAELVTLKALEIAERNANKEYQKEHVLPYILENSDKFYIIKVNAPDYLRRFNYYLTVDFPEDLKLIREIVRRIEGNKKEKTPLGKIIKLLDENPSLVNINSNCMRVLKIYPLKSILFRADGSKQIGMGHITRGIEVAKYLKDYCDRIYFLTKNNPIAIDYIHKNGFNTIIFQNTSYKEINTKIEEIFDEGRFDDIILDLYNIHQSDIDFYKKFCNRVICFTDETYKLEIVADIIFAFSPNQKEEYYTNISKGIFYVGPKYEPLNPVFSNKRKKVKEKIEQILVTMGGGDRNNLTTRVLNNLLGMNYNFEITAILGHGFGETNLNTINRYREQSVIIKKNVEDMYSEMLKTDIGICSAGNTLVEFMSLGIPTLVLPQTKRENEHATAFEKRGAILKVPNYGSEIEDVSILKLLKKLVTNVDLREKISKSALEIVDGKGIYRIVDILTGKEGGKHG